MWNLANVKISSSLLHKNERQWILGIKIELPIWGMEDQPSCPVLKPPGGATRLQIYLRPIVEWQGKAYLNFSLTCTQLHPRASLHLRLGDMETSPLCMSLYLLPTHLLEKLNFWVKQRCRRVDGPIITILSNEHYFPMKFPENTWRGGGPSPQLTHNYPPEALLSTLFNNAPLLGPKAVTNNKA